MAHTLPPHENQTTSLRSSPSFSYEENILKDNILIWGGLVVLLFLQHSFEKGSIDVMELKLLMRGFFFLAIVYFEFRHLHITQNTKITGNFLAIIIQKIAFYVLLGMAIFSPDLTVKIYCAIGVLVSKSIHIVPTGRGALVSRNGKHIATKTGTFTIIPFLDVVKWEKDPSQEKPKPLRPQYSQKTSKTLPYKDQPLFRSPFEIYLVAGDKNGKDVCYTFELHTFQNISYHQKEHYIKSLRKIVEEYTLDLDKDIDFFLNPVNKLTIERTFFHKLNTLSQKNNPSNLQAVYMKNITTNTTHPIAYKEK